MRISKGEAAQRQLDTAIGLYFAEGDPVAIHTLAAAAYELVTALREGEGITDEITDMIIPGRQKEFRQVWNQAQNFFKHADRDSDAILEFDPAQTELRLFMASLRYDAVGTRTESMIAFQIWFSMHNIDVMLDPAIQTVLRTAHVRWQNMPRTAFREMIAEGAEGILR
jgi:hypothetical protein